MSLEAEAGLGASPGGAGIGENGGGRKRSPQAETISLAALWTAVQNYNAEITTDPVTVIS